MREILRWIHRRTNNFLLLLIGTIITFAFYQVHIVLHSSIDDRSVEVLFQSEENSCKEIETIERSISITSVVQSTWSCSGNMNYEHGWKARTCEFRNICYDKQKHIFQFYRAPGSVKQPILFEPSQGHTYEFNTNGHGFVNLLARPSKTGSWGPTIVNERLPPSSDIPYLEPVHVLFMHSPMPCDPTSIIWEDIASTYFAMVRLQRSDPKAILIEYRDYPHNDSQLEEMYKNLVPAFASKVVSLDNYMNDFSSSIVCFRSVIAGGSTPVFSIKDEPYSHGKERLLFNYRSAILRYHGIDLMHPPTSHRIILVNKTQEQDGILRAIKNLHQVAEFIRLKYSSIPVDIIQWESMSFTRQLQELYSATILITPCGSVASIVPFLPKNAHAIIMDYYVNPEAFSESESYRIGESGSMDAAIWNYFPHIRKLYYQVRSKEDFVFDFPTASNTRHDASIIIKMPRLKELIDTAIQNSGSPSTA